MICLIYDMTISQSPEGATKFTLWLLRNHERAPPAVASYNNEWANWCNLVSVCFFITGANLVVLQLFFLHIFSWFLLVWFGCPYRSAVACLKDSSLFRVKSDVKLCWLSLCLWTELRVFRCNFQAGRPPGKPVEVGEFDVCQRKVREIRKLGKSWFACDMLPQFR